MTVEYIVPKGVRSGVSLRAFLRQQCGFSQGLWRRLKWNGTVQINGETVRATAAVVHAGDVVTCYVPEETALTRTPMELDIRYEDAYVLVLNKPAGILVHPTGKDHTNTLGNGILHYYEVTGQHLDFHPVHRLDRNTSGLVLVAKLPQMQNVLTQQGKGKFFQRSYLAVVQGAMPARAGTIDLPIARHPESIIQRVCDESGQSAITHYRTLAQNKGKSLLELRLETGRTHQIRVHLATLGHPILGDDLYGGDTTLIQRQALHAYHLEMDNPLSGEHVSVYADLPRDIINAFQA